MPCPSAKTRSYQKCPYCNRLFQRCGGGVTNHIWSTLCWKKRDLVLRASRTHRHTSGSPLSVPDGPSLCPAQNSRTQGQSNDLDPLMESLPGENDCNNPLLDPLMKSLPGENDFNNPLPPTTTFHIEQASNHANFVFPSHTETLRESQMDNSKSYIPWKLEEEWELVHWLGSSQLSWSDINNFLKLKWISNIFCYCNKKRCLGSGASDVIDFSMCECDVQHGKGHAWPTRMEFWNHHIAQCSKWAADILLLGPWKKCTLLIPMAWSGWTDGLHTN